MVRKGSPWSRCVPRLELASCHSFAIRELPGMPDALFGMPSGPLRIMLSCFAQTHRNVPYVRAGGA